LFPNVNQLIYSVTSHNSTYTLSHSSLLHWIVSLGRRCIFPARCYSAKWNLILSRKPGPWVWQVDSSFSEMLVGRMTGWGSAVCLCQAPWESADQMHHKYRYLP